MSGASDKARFYLEQAVPQLQEFEQKKIFTKEEIRTLVKKRSAFEHKILARGSLPLDFARYAAWEISLESLRSKRCKRLLIKSSSAHASQARIFQIFDRGTRKHPGDLGLWMSYLAFARDAKAVKKFKTVLTAMLRLHCTKAELWLYAAKAALDDDTDLNAARGYFQRGMRFCRVPEMWVEYAKLEMVYLARIVGRRKVLGLDGKTSLAVETNNAAEDQEFDASDDVIMIPDFKPSLLLSNDTGGAEAEGAEAEEPEAEEPEVEEGPTKDLMTTPALSGDIPLAIFADAQKQSFYNANTAESFFDMFSAFNQVPSQPRIVQHVVDTMRDQFPQHPFTCNCFVRQPMVGIDAMTAEFPMALSKALERLDGALEETSDRDTLVVKSSAWMQEILGVEGLDEGILKVLRFKLRKLV